MPKISFCASSIRPQYWSKMYTSLEANNLDWEMVMVGPNPGTVPGPKCKYIQSNVKPAQCYEIAFRHAKGNLISWTADDAVYTPRAVDEMFRFYHSFNTNKLVTAFRTIEDGRDITDVHRLRGRDMGAPVMAPFGVIDRVFFGELGGYDRRFLCGQSENDIVMRVMEVGGSSVQIHPTASAIVSHQEAHSSGTKFRSNNFHIDRAVLESNWIVDGRIQTKRQSAVIRFSDINILTETQGENGGGQW